MVSELPLLEQGTVLLMRQLCDGEQGRAAVAAEFVAALDEGQGRMAAMALDRLLTLMVRHGRRPFMRHDLCCQCLGGDESAFSTIVAVAAAGDREDVTAFALTMMPAAFAI